jgi:16S rRNA (guanine966-N2)-methyltransferase
MGTLTITGGTLRSRRVPTPPGRAVRPTPARVKEALFSILGARVGDARVLDLFAGSGALGFESLSRGAAHVTFVEKHRPTADGLRAAARELGVDQHVDVIAAPAERAARALTGRYDLVFADPPYAHDYPRAAFAALRERRAIDPATTVVYEHSAREPAPDDPAMRVDRTERYGEVALAFMHPQPLDRAA